jgi:DNA polymerase-4
MSHYQSVSRQIFAVFAEFTPLVEGLSLDEAFLDVTGSLNLFGSAADIARQIKMRVRDETALTASVGVAPNKLVAKIASDLDKPDGLVVVTGANLLAVLDPLPVRVLPGIGPETLARLQQAGIGTLADLRRAPDRSLEPVFGRFAGRARERAAGIDERPVLADRNDKSISAEETYGKDLIRIEDMQRELLRLTERTTRRLRSKQLLAGTVQVKIRQSDFTTFTRQQRMQPAACDTDSIYRAACSLLSTWLAAHPGTRIRLLGVGGSDLGHSGQADLFASQSRTHVDGLDRAADDIRKRFADIPVGRARGLDSNQIR